MKGNSHPMRILLAILVAGILIVFFTGFGSLNASFLLGFLACLICVGLVVMLAFMLEYRPARDHHVDLHTTWSTRSYVLLFVAALVIAGGVFSVSILLKQNADVKSRAYVQSAHARQQWELVEAVRSSSHGYLIANVLDQVDHELRNNPGGVLSLETIARIAAVSYGCRPYRILEGDSLSEEKYSPERGQLLLTLARMSIDSVSFERIRLGTTFACAYLRGANLHRADLRGVDLSEACLVDANLSGADLSGAKLTRANLWGAEMGGVILQKADLREAELSWANLHKSLLSEAEMGGAKLKYATLSGSDLTDSDLRVADLSGASLKDSDLTGAYVYAVNLRRADLRNANLTEVVLRNAHLEEANILRANLTQTEVQHKDWLERLKTWNVTGAEEALAEYETTDDATGLFYVVVRRTK